MKPLQSLPGQAALAVLLLGLGGGAGALAIHATRPAVEMAPTRAVPIRSLAGRTGLVTIRARVAETYGNSFVADDGSARTLVDLGRAGDEEKLVADGQTVTAQGRFDRGKLHAAFLVDAAGTVHALAPPPGPPPGGHRPPPPPPPPRG